MKVAGSRQSEAARYGFEASSDSMGSEACVKVAGSRQSEAARYGFEASSDSMAAGGTGRAGAVGRGLSSVGGARSQRRGRSVGRLLRRV